MTGAVDRVQAGRGGGALHELAFVTLDESLLELLSHPAVLVARPGAARWNIYPAEAALSVKVAWYLTDVCSADDAATWLIPGSHLRDTLARPAHGSMRPPGAEPLLVSALAHLMPDAEDAPLRDAWML